MLKWWNEIYSRDCNKLQLRVQSRGWGNNGPDSQGGRAPPPRTSATSATQIIQTILHHSLFPRHSLSPNVRPFHTPFIFPGFLLSQARAAVARNNNGPQRSSERGSAPLPRCRRAVPENAWVGDFAAVHQEQLSG